MKKTLISPPGHPASRGTYSPGVLVEDKGTSTLFVTGQLAVDPQGNVVAPHDTAAQTEFVFALIGAVLREAGMGFEDVVKVNTYLTHMPDFPKFAPVRNRIFEKVWPAHTLVEAKGLALEGCCVEVEVIAMKATG